MAQVSYIKKVRVSADVGDNKSWLELPCSSPTLDFGGDVLDDTNLRNLTPTGYRTMLLGLHTWSVGCDSFYEAAGGTDMDDNGGTALDLVRQAKIGRTPLFVQYLPNGVAAGEIIKGFQGAVVVENFNLSGGISDLESVSITLQGNGELTVASA